MTTGTIFNIQRYSIHDGPGVRTTVFLKGCPLSCPWCHNPEGLSRRPQLIYRENRCNLCRDCVSACPTGALSSSEDVISVDDGRCDGCGRCQEACPAGALEIAGREMTLQQVMAEVERDTIFYDQSGGGVTFSGGEPLLQAAFLRDLLAACRGQEIRTALDTTGYAPPETLWRVAPLVDLFLFDLKVMDSRRHRTLTGVENGPILANLRELVRRGYPTVLRVPIIPTMTDDQENILAIGELARSLGDRQRVDLLPYHGMAREKYGRLRKEYRLPDLQPPSRERMSQMGAMLEGLGLIVNTGG